MPQPAINSVFIYYVALEHQINQLNHNTDIDRGRRRGKKNSPTCSSFFSVELVKRLECAARTTFIISRRIWIQQWTRCFDSATGKDEGVNLNAASPRRPRGGIESYMLKAASFVSDMDLASITVEWGNVSAATRLTVHLQQNTTTKKDWLYTKNGLNAVRFISNYVQSAHTGHIYEWIIMEGVNIYAFDTPRYVQLLSSKRFRSMKEAINESTVNA